MTLKVIPSPCSSPSFSPTMWQLHQVSYRVGPSVLIDDISLTVRQGEVLAICGPNGAGKSTLLHLLSGALRPIRGTIRFLERPLSRWSWRELAQQRAVLGQEQTANFPLKVRDIVSLGRDVFAGHDAQRIVPLALETMDAAHLAERLYPSLSGGERQRVQLARVLAQIWEMPNAALLLDEPLNHLDLAHQHQILRSVRTLARRGVTVVVVLHDLNLALHYADQLVLLQGGKLVAWGEPQTVCAAPQLSKVFGLPLALLPHPHGGYWVWPAQPLPSEENCVGTSELP